MERRVREQIIEDVEPVTTRVVTERRVAGGGYGPAFGANPVAMGVAAVLFVFILVLVFGVLL